MDNNVPYAILTGSQEADHGQNQAIGHEAPNWMLSSLEIGQTIPDGWVSAHVVWDESK